MLLCLQRNLNLLDEQSVKGHEEFIGFVSVNSQSYEVQATLTKHFSSNYNLELVAPIEEPDFTQTNHLKSFVFGHLLKLLCGMHWLFDYF